MENFTPISALLGGALIGLASGLYLLLNGRIAGISGILGGLMSRGSAMSERLEKLAFIIGMIVGPIIVIATSPIQAQSVVDASLPVIIVAGLIVGFGTRLGSGCTSGHGICGLSRLSARSLVATLCFMGAGMACTFVVRHVIGG
ncbi:YeeE/YedE family protein [Thalassospira alkalitolerans]|uniref:YeeE/YedE family protein n=1 Tax=Thalassospira alkalitolerans TaxID=1293890 RepID=A0A1Y2LHG3_9PROT|nr:YeeE/YedE family protein [Thalassospira alkalitolerans]OSQ50298.1 YeeE/YedE family protein [Thalassospira alkalitolerans]|tara:strand:+ start:4898 stop:5329 length:432 start_codon:yes stop_codon:yes gene_type:complete